MKIHLLAGLLLIGMLTSANSPKSSDDKFGRSLPADHVLTSTSAARQIIKANARTYIAIPIMGIEVQGWMIEPFACPVEMLRKAVRIETSGLGPRDVTRIYGEIAAHNEAIARLHAPRSCVRLGG
jgi:hypothetical protein